MSDEWEDNQRDLLALGTPRRSLYDDVLKEYYLKPLITQLNESFLWHYGPPVPASWYEERGLPLPWVYVPPPWYKREWRNLKWKLRDTRRKFGRWVGGIEPEHDDWYD